MPLTDSAYWSDHLRQTLQRYEANLLREVATKLVRPRNQWPVAELVDRCVTVMGNTAVIDRRLAELEPAGRQLLALIAHSRQPRWSLGNLIELLMSLGHAEGLPTILQLFERGLLYPDLPAANITRLKNFELWVNQSADSGPQVFAHPLVAIRALGEDLKLPVCATAAAAKTPPGEVIHEADGLELPLRLAALWQLVQAAPLRRTSQGDFFKRDWDRLSEDPLLNAAPAETLTTLPDPALLVVALAEIEGVVQTDEHELHAGVLPAFWEEGLEPTLASLWAALPRLTAWDATEGWHGATPARGNPGPSAHLVALLLLARLPADMWVHPAEVESWIRKHHPFWRGSRIEENDTVITQRDDPSSNLHPPTSILHLPFSILPFLLGVAFQLRMIQAMKSETGDWLIRLSPLGRWLLGLAELPAKTAAYPQTLLVQPNLEIVAYRQGLTPGLVVRLNQFAAWKSLGAACMLQLQPETVYRALESGQSFDSILHTLEQYGMRQTPAAVVESLRTWAGKRDRIRVFPSAVILEFGTADELNDALARGLPAVRITDCMAVAAEEEEIDFRHFRLIGTRDYSLPPDQCVAVGDDGVTLSVDVTRSDLLLETELPRFTELLNRTAMNGCRQYRLTPASLAGARNTGMNTQTLESWFVQRTGQALPAAVRLLMTGDEQPPVSMQKHLVMQLATPEMADGLLQWPETRSFIQARLGPTALVVAEEHAAQLLERMQSLGMRVQISG